MTEKEILEKVKEDNVKFISLQFTDVYGAVKSVDIPQDALQQAMQQGVFFDGSSVEGFARIQESDMHLVLDKDTYAVLPWSSPELKRARMFCDIYTPDGEPFIGDPRGALKRMMAKAEARGWTYKCGAEPEFFLYKRTEDNIHPVPHDVGGYFDFSANDDAVTVRTELMAALASMNLEVEMGHHEVALGQHEINFRFSNALKAADQVLTLKYTVKAIAAKHGLIASFMPKPMFGANGSGMHTHQSLFDKDGTNLFYDPDTKMNLSELGTGYIAGLLKHAKPMAAILNPTVNSYKRLVPGYEAPVYIGYAQINRSALVRIPASGGRPQHVRAELRNPDPAANPYLAFAVMLAAGMDGIDNKIPCPDDLNNINIYKLSAEERQKQGIEQLPGSLAESLKELEQDTVLQDALGPVLYNAFNRAKWAEWEEYRTRIMDWEIERYLETA